MDQARRTFLEDTQEFWQGRTSRALTLEDARQAVENVTGFFTTLERWAADESSRADYKQTAEAA